MKSKLIWDEWNKEHIQKHNVTVKEIVEVYKSTRITKQSYQNRILILGKTKKNRLLTIVLSTEKQKYPYVVSARDMSKKERIYYHEQTETH